jgi:hypothetical protein
LPAYQPPGISDARAHVDPLEMLAAVLLWRLIAALVLALVGAFLVAAVFPGATAALVICAVVFGATAGVVWEAKALGSDEPTEAPRISTWVTFLGMAFAGR